MATTTNNRFFWYIIGAALAITLALLLILNRRYLQHQFHLLQPVNYYHSEIKDTLRN
jgi:hypothetical protein